MTMPSERTRALRWAGEFLREALELPEMPVELKREIRAILRHYPSTSEIALQAKRREHAPPLFQWLGPEDQDREQNPTL